MRKGADGRGTTEGPPGEVPGRLPTLRDLLFPRFAVMSSALLSLPEFLTRWEASGAAERANYQLFLSELCDQLDVPRPEPTVPDDAQNAYVFERSVTFTNADGTVSPGRIDLYRRDCFVLKAKQGKRVGAVCVIVIVSTGRIDADARRYAASVVGSTGLCIVLLGNDQLRMIADSPPSIADLLAESALSRFGGGPLLLKAEGQPFPLTRHAPAA